MDPAEALRICAEGVRQDKGIPPVILGAGHRVAITKAIELLRVDGKDLEAALHEGFHHGTPRHLNGDRDVLRVPRRHSS